MQLGVGEPQGGPIGVNDLENEILCKGRIVFLGVEKMRSFYAVRRSLKY